MVVQLPILGPRRWTPLLLLILTVVCPRPWMAEGKPQAAGGDSTGTIFGTLVDGTRAIPWAIVMVKGTWIQDQTAEDGSFRLTDVPVGPVVLRVRRVHRADFTQKVTVHAGQGDTVLVRVPSTFVVECPRPTPGCVSHDARQRKRLGKPCERHSWIALAADTVRVVLAHVHSKVFDMARRDSFPNAMTLWEEPAHTVMGRVTLAPPNPFGRRPGSGWVSGRTVVPAGIYWMEVAYCRECRAAYSRHRGQ